MKIGKFIIFGVGVVCGYKYHDKIENKINNISGKIVERIRYKAADVIKSAINKALYPEDGNKTHGYCHDHEYHPNCRTNNKAGLKHDLYVVNEEVVHIYFDNTLDALDVMKHIGDKVLKNGFCTMQHIRSFLGDLCDYRDLDFGFYKPVFSFDFDSDGACHLIIEGLEKINHD